MPNVELFMTRTKLRPGVRTTRANFFLFVFLVGAITGLDPKNWHRPIYFGLCSAHEATYKAKFSCRH